LVSDYEPNALRIYRSEKFLFSTSVGAGIPVLSLVMLQSRWAKVQKFLGVLYAAEIVFAFDCAAGTQSHANQPGRLRGVVETAFSHSIASHSPFRSG
jgi:hypothetical protein